MANGSVTQRDEMDKKELGIGAGLRTRRNKIHKNKEYFEVNE